MEKAKAVLERTVDGALHASSVPLRVVEDYIGWDLVAAIVLWTLCLFGVWRLIIISTRVLKRRSLQRRGLIISGEALVEGSAFVMAEPYSFQINVLTPGFLMDGFAGMGGRVGDWLAMPGHVFDAAVREGAVLLQNPAKPAQKIPVKGHVVQSAVYSDVKYLRVPIQVWSQLGVSKAPKPEKVRSSVTAAVWGFKGKTTGLCCLMENPEFIHFTGSTVPGYSGTFYMSTYGGWLGMHLGAVTGKSTNVGARADLLAAEVECLEGQYQALNPEGFRKPEAGSDSTSSSTARKQAMRNQRRNYDEEDEMLQDRIRSAYSRTHKPTAEEELQRYARTASGSVWKVAKSQAEHERDLRDRGVDLWADEMDLDEESFKSPAAMVKAIFNALDESDRRDLLAILTAVQIAPQATHVDAMGPNKVKILQDNAAHKRIDQLEKRVAKIESRMTKSEGKAEQKPTAKAVAVKAPVEKKKTPEQPKVLAQTKPVAPQKERESLPSTSSEESVSEHKCDLCGKVMSTGKRLRTHRYFAHADQMPQIRRQRKLDGKKAETVKEALRIAREGSLNSDEDPEIAVASGSGPFLGSHSPKPRRTSC